MPNDPRKNEDVRALFKVLKSLEYDKLRRKLKHVKNEDDLGWVRYLFRTAETPKPWQEIVINRYLERDKFFRNILPAWVGVILAVLSFVVAVLALVVALNPPKP